MDGNNELFRFDFSPDRESFPVAALFDNQSIHAGLQSYTRGAVRQPSAKPRAIKGVERDGRDHLPAVAVRQKCVDQNAWGARHIDAIECFAQRTHEHGQPRSVDRGRSSDVA